jgi:hypothetical protein
MCLASSAKSTQRGDETTPIITAHDSISSNSAAHYCQGMTYGGYTDWYLPSKSELAYLYCKSNVGSHNTSYPQEDPNCVEYGGKTSELEVFDAGRYLSSTQRNTWDAWDQSFIDGEQGYINKENTRWVRCIRRY